MKQVAGAPPASRPPRERAADGSAAASPGRGGRGGAFARARPAALGLASFGLAFSVGAFCHRHQLEWPLPHADEATYLAAFELLEAGRDPYGEPTFLYPPPFAVLGSQARSLLGDDFLPFLRLANLAGASLLAVLAVAGSSWAWPWRIAAACAATASPLVGDGLQTGNVSLAMWALTAVGLLAALRDRPLAGGGLLGALNAVKPLSVAAVAVLAAPDRGRGWDRRRVLAAVVAAAASAAFLGVGWRLVPAWVGRAGELPSLMTHVSFRRALFALGVPVHPLVPFAVVVLAGVALAYRRRPAPRQRLALALSTALLGQPINNPSTFVGTLPAQVLALERAVAQLRREWAGPGRRRALAEAALTFAAVLSVNGTLGVAAAGDLSLPGQGLVTLIPLLATAGLTLYATGPRN